MHIATGRTTATVLSVLVMATLAGCSSGGPAAPIATGGQAADQANGVSSGLATALDQIPDMTDGDVMYTDWSMLGHRNAGNDPNVASFAGELTAIDTVLQRNLGIKSTDAQWEVDVYPHGGAPVVVLGFDEHTDLSGLASRLTRLGYHANGPILTGPAHPKTLWEYYLRDIGIDPSRHLLADSSDLTTLRSVLTPPAHPLGRASEVVPLLALASARLGNIASAAALIGPMACVKLTGLIRAPTPQMVAAVRKMFHGTFTPPQAEITAVGTSSSKTALNAQAFPDQRTAQANRAGRSAAYKVMTRVMLGGTSGYRVTGSAVTGRVLSFNLAANQAGDFPQLVAYNGLGVDICP